jgi:hypothetical protein
MLMSGGSARHADVARNGELAVETLQELRIRTVKEAQDDEVHGLWISDEMANSILVRLDSIVVKGDGSDVESFCVDRIKSKK